MSAVSSINEVELGFSAITLGFRLRLQWLASSTLASQELPPPNIAGRRSQVPVKQAFIGKLHNFCCRDLQGKVVGSRTEEYLFGILEGLAVRYCRRGSPAARRASRTAACLG